MKALKEQIQTKLAEKKLQKQQIPYTERLDKEWSLTDCASFVVMRTMGLTEAFTSDHHFEQAGFNMLIKD